MDLTPNPSNPSPITTNNLSKIPWGVIIVIIVIILGGVGNYLRKNDEQKIANDLVKLNEEFDLVEGLNTDKDYIKEGAEYKTGFGKLLKEFLEKNEEIGSDIEKYFNDFVELPTTYFTDLEGSKRTVNALRVAFEDVAQKELDLFESFQEDLGRYSPKNDTEKELIKGFEIGLNTTTEREKEFFDLMIKLLNLCDEQLDLLINNKEVFEYNEVTEEMLINDDAILEQYNEIATEISKTSDEMMVLFDEYTTAQKEASKSFNALLEEAE